MARYRRRSCIGLLAVAARKQDPSGSQPRAILLAKSFEHYYDTSAAKWSHAATWRYIMLRLRPIEPVPHETARITRAAVPKGQRYLRLADDVETLFADDAFRALFPTHG
jgi:hypothetical protein